MENEILAKMKDWELITEEQEEAILEHMEEI